MDRVPVRVEQADRDRLDAQDPELRDGRAGLGLVERPQDRAVGQDALGDLDPELAGTRGTGGSMNRSYMSYRPSRPISTASRNPEVASSPTRAPFRSISALVASVVPWIRARTPAGPAPASWSSVTTPSSTACDGSLGVVRSLPTRTAPVVSSTQTRSVKVPPMSTPMRDGLPLAAMDSPLVGAGLGRDLGWIRDSC